VLWFIALRARGFSDPKGTGAPSFNFRQLILAAWTVLAFSGLLDATRTGLLGIPDMAVAGNGSTRELLRWSMDRINGDMPVSSVFWLPMWVFRVLMLCWALWLAFSLISWLRWGWNNFSRKGVWRSMEFRPLGLAKSRKSGLGAPGKDGGVENKSGPVPGNPPEP
jgi:hypothetical protein